MSNAVVLYHDSCADGFTAAYVCWRELGDSAKYIPVQYGQPLPDIGDASDIYIVDFSYPKDVLIELASRESVFKVVVLDHHKTAQAALADTDNAVPGLHVVFDMDRSGAMLAWDYWRGGFPAPQLVQYVQDRDLWQWKLADSREISAAISIELKTFEIWSLLSTQMELASGLRFMRDRGAAILQAQQTYVSGLASKACFVEIAGHFVPAVNSLLFQSEIGEELCKQHPESAFGAIWFCQKLGEETWSLRSRNGFDVSAVAKHYGGGGHAAAAGFRVSSGIIGNATVTSVSRDRRCQSSI